MIGGINGIKDDHLNHLYLCSYVLSKVDPNNSRMLLIENGSRFGRAIVEQFSPYLKSIYIGMVLQYFEMPLNARSV